MNEATATVRTSRPNSIPSHIITNEEFDDRFAIDIVQDTDPNSPNDFILTMEMGLKITPDKYSYRLGTYNYWHKKSGKAFPSFIGFQIPVDKDANGDPIYGDVKMLIDLEAVLPKGKSPQRVETDNSLKASEPVVTSSDDQPDGPSESPAD